MLKLMEHIWNHEWLSFKLQTTSKLNLKRNCEGKIKVTFFVCDSHMSVFYTGFVEKVDGPVDP